MTDGRTSVAREGLLDGDLAFPTGADVVRGRRRIRADAGDVDKAFHAGLARHPGDARRRLDVNSAESLPAATVGVKADGVHGPVGTGKRRCDRGLLVHIGSDRIRSYAIRLEECRQPLWVARGGPHAEAAVQQMPDHPMP